MKNLMQLLRDNAGTERKPLNLVRSEGAKEATLYVYDVIDSYWGVNAQDVAKAISGLDADTTLHLRVNSPGGDVFEARAIAASIRAFGGKTVAHIDALAASAATSIAIACDEVEISDGGFFMIHNAWTLAYGNKDDFAETISLLTKIDDGIVADYSQKTGKSADEIVAWMNAETWFTAQEAVDNGFADRMAPAPEKKKNTTGKSWNLAAFNKAPKALTEPPEPEPDVDERLAAAHAHNVRRMRLFETC
jgi:ATP-dependent Clp protease protease subunit